MIKRPLCLAAVLLFLIQAVLIGGFRLAGDLRPSALESAAEEGDTVEVRGTVSYREEKESYQVYHLTDNQVRLHNQIRKESKILVYIKKEQSQFKTFQTEEPQIKKAEIENQQIRQQLEERTQTERLQTEEQQAESLCTEAGSSFALGNQILVKGEVGFFDEARNPGNFDPKFYYQKQGIHACIWAEESGAKLIDGSVWRLREMLAGFRENWKTMLVESLGEEDGNSMSAIMLGDKNGLDADLKELYQKSGIGHILAISGLHLSFIGIGIYKILRKLTGSYPVGGACGMLFLALYIVMIGFTVSAVRALVMFLFRVGADMAGRHYDAPTALSAAAVITLLWRPLSLFDGGFWLSFGAVLAILLVVPVVQRKTEGRFQRNVRKDNSKVQEIGKQGRIYEDNRRTRVYECICRIRISVIQGFTASVCINLVILPVLLYYFFEFPLYSFIMNLFVIPLMSVLLFLGMAGSLLFLGMESLSKLIFRLCRVILWIYKESCNSALGLPGARLVIGKPEFWQIMVYYGILAFALYLIKSYQNFRNSQNRQSCQNGWNHHFQNSSIYKSRYCENETEKTLGFRWKKLFAILLWTTGLFILVFRWGEHGKLTTVVLDVGQGDGIFMKGPEGGTYLVDGGSSDVKKVGQYRLEPFLKSQGVGTLDYVLISHGDSDHMNGVEELIERQDIGVRIGTLALPVQEVWDEALEGLAKKAQSSGIRVVTIDADQSIREGEMTLTCIQPGNMNKETAGSTEFPSGNAASMILAVQYGEFDMLLTGDVEQEGEEQLTKRLEEQYRDYVWEVLKVAHHGSKNSSAEEFLRQVRPAYAFVSAGQENRYGHPHQETIERLADAGSKIYSTQENGAIIVEVKDGRTLKIEKYEKLSL